MPSQGLVLCEDAQVLSVLQGVLAETGIAATVCTAASTAEGMLAADRFNPIIVDCDGQEAGTMLLERVRQSGPNFESITLAIVRTLDGMRNAYAAGANLVLWKPINKEEATRVVRATQGLSNRRRRRWARRAVAALAYVSIEGVAEPAIITELSEGGMGVQAFDPVKAGRVVQLRFVLPATAVEIVADADIAWSDATGRAGLVFTLLPETARAAIAQWMSAESCAAIPAPHSASDTTKRRLAWLFDAVLVGGATALFLLIYVLVSRALLSRAGTAITWVAGFLLLGLVYRFVFFRDPARTPGAQAAEHVCALYFARGGRGLLKPSRESSPGR